MEQNESNFWRRCNSCKKSIAFSARHYVCSVSTCNGQRTGYVFCSVTCFEVHLPGARHKNAAAIESQAPVAGAAAREPQRTIIKSASGTTQSPSLAQLPRETLIIASRLKEYVQAKSEMNTSASVMDVLSDYVRVLSDRAMENARADGRKTVLDRDFEFLKKESK